MDHYLRSEQFNNKRDKTITTTKGRKQEPHSLFHKTISHFNHCAYVLVAAVSVDFVHLGGAVDDCGADVSVGVAESDNASGGGTCMPMPITMGLSTEQARCTYGQSPCNRRC
jgi:hypothetical protein